MANVEHYRLTILKRLTHLIEGASIDEGYDHDLRGRVVRGRTLLGDNDKVPFISIIESPRPDFGIFTDQKDARIEQWDLLIQGWAETVGDHPADCLYPLMADVESRLFRAIAEESSSGLPMFPADYMLGGLIAGMTVQPGVIRPPSQEQPVAKACFLLPIRLGLANAVGTVPSTGP